jgi:hypothetical protein
MEILMERTLSEDKEAKMQAVRKPARASKAQQK